MTALISRLRLFLQSDTRGVTALEYALIAAVISGVVITGATNVGNGLTNTFTKVGNTLTRANG